MRLPRKDGLTTATKRLAGAERGDTAERGKEQVSFRTGRSRKVIERESVVEALLQLRDDLDRYLEELNDLVVCEPSPPDEEDDVWPIPDDERE